MCSSTQPLYLVRALAPSKPLFGFLRVEVIDGGRRGEHGSRRKGRKGRVVEGRGWGVGGGGRWRVGGGGRWRVGGGG